jgi:hypothetical protein
MFNKFARILLTATALAPVGLAYAWIAWLQDAKGAALIIVGISLLLVVLCLSMFWKAPKAVPVSDFEASSVEPADHENIAFLLLYAMPLFTSQFNTLDWTFWIPTGIMFAAIAATGYAFHFNPLLGLLGWHFFKVQSKEGVTFVLITRKRIRDAAKKLRVGELTEYILVDVGES